MGAIRDTDIFGSPKGDSGIRDADIFQTPKVEEKPSMPVPMEAPPKEYNAMQRRMGLGKTGNTMEDIRQAIDTAPYRLGGAVTDLTGSPAAGYVANVAGEAVPAILGGELIKAAAAPKMISAAQSVMQSALKPTYEQLRTGKAAQAIDTMLNEGINVSEGGLSKLHGQIGTLNDQVKGAIAASPATIQKSDVGRSLVDTFQKFQNQVNPQADLEAIKKAWLNFRNHPLLAGKTDIPVQLAQDMKQGTYRALSDKAYGEVGGASQEAQKSLARGLKEGISKAVPAVGPLNAKESELLNAANVLERRVLVSGNNNQLGLTPLGVNPLSWLLFMTDRSPRAMSVLARGLNAGAGQIPATTARAGIGYYMMPPEDQRGALYFTPQ